MCDLSARVMRRYEYVTGVLTLAQPTVAQLHGEASSKAQPQHLISQYAALAGLMSTPCLFLYEYEYVVDME